jgi:uncharacterized membrane protein HdeD (DUF308 family)
VAGVSLTLLLGGLLVVAGVTQIVGAFRAQGWGGFLWQMLLGGIGILAGLALFFNTALGLVTLTLLVITYLFVSGVVEIIMGIQLRGEVNWLVSIASGVIGILLAVMLWAGFPSTAVWAIGVLFGVNLLVTGGSMVFLALGARRATRTVEREQAAEAGGV